uniref:Uncharacterized protein n=1 Tax=Candidatus Kentrum sp. TC TaxID=2126339 RepID=A0A450Z3G8_9GAMM|nr:MAG: hypothetical protein BECKTC1821E_GA0114239_11113 [Candidatus Kentron sp. TC]
MVAGPGTHPGRVHKPYGKSIKNIGTMDFSEKPENIPEQCGILSEWSYVPNEKRLLQHYCRNSHSSRQALSKYACLGSADYRQQDTRSNR